MSSQAVNTLERDSVVCRECGKQLQKLVGGKSHLQLKHGMTKAEYVAKWPGAPVVSLTESRRLSEQTHQTWRSELTGKRPRRHVRGHDEPAAPLWPMIGPRANGASEREIGEIVNRTEGAVHYALESVGLAGEPAVYDCGQPCTSPILIQLRDASGLTASEFAKKVGVPERQFVEATRPSRAAKNRRVHPDLARKVIGWREKLLRRIFERVQASHSADAVNKPRILKTLVPNLSQNYSILVGVLRRLQEALRNEPANERQSLPDYFCTQAKREVRSGHKGIFVEFLAWAPDLIPSIEENRARIKESELVSEMAHELLAARWKLTRNMVFEGLKARTRKIPRSEMRYRILALSRSPGAPEKPTHHRHDARFRQQVDAVLSRFTKGAEILARARREFPGKPEQLQIRLAEAGFSKPEIDALCSTRTPKSAAILWTAQRTGIKFKTGQNLYSDHSREVPEQ